MWVDLTVLAQYANTDSGPVISPVARDRINSLIQQSIDEGAELLLDGRNPSVDGLADGNWVGPTILRGSAKNVGYTWVSLPATVALCLRLEPRSLDPSCTFSRQPLSTMPSHSSTPTPTGTGHPSIPHPDQQHGTLHTLLSPDSWASMCPFRCQSRRLVGVETRAVSGEMCRSVRGLLHLFLSHLSSRQA